MQKIDVKIFINGLYLNIIVSGTRNVYICQWTCRCESEEDIGTIVKVAKVNRSIQLN